MCVSGGRKRSFFGKFGMFVFLKIFQESSIYLITDELKPGTDPVEWNSQKILQSAVFRRINKRLKLPQIISKLKIK